MNQGLSLQLFGTNHAQVFVKDIEEFPATYKEKMFKPHEIKPTVINFVKTELNLINKNANDVTIDGVGEPSASDEKNIGKILSDLFLQNLSVVSQTICQNGTFFERNTNTISENEYGTLVDNH